MGTVGPILKKFPSIGACGLDCGLCPRFYTTGPSRCPGCCGIDFFKKHPTCSFITCCVRKKGLEVCATCPDFRCTKFKSEEGYATMKESSSYPPARKILSNLDLIREKGIAEFAAEQGNRMSLLASMIANFDDGRSRSFYCRAAALLLTATLEKSLHEALQESGSAAIVDIKKKARILRNILNKAAETDGVVLFKESQQ